MSQTINIKIGSAITPDLLDVAYISLNSIKCNKKSTTKIDYYLFIEYTFSFNEYYCKHYLDDLISDDFQIHYIDANLYTKNIKAEKNCSAIMYVKCLFPKIFSEFDKILYLDIDVFCLKDGIEELWETNIEEYYVGAVISGNVTWNPARRKDYYNTKTRNYFNAGVILMNLTNIRKDSLDISLDTWVKSWNYSIIACILNDQTLLNYLFRQHVLLLPLIWNNRVLVTDIQSKFYKEKALKLYGHFNDAILSLSETVFIHFNNGVKPWNEADMNTKSEKNYPYINVIKNIWNELLIKYKKKGKSYV